MTTQIINYVDYWTASSSYSCQAFPDQAVQLHDASRRNLLIWEDCGSGEAINKQVTTHVQLTNLAFQQNAGLVLNYRVVTPLTNPHVEYHAIQLDRNTNRIQLLRFNGQSLVAEHSVIPGAPFTFDDWYHISATIVPGTGNSVQVAVTITCLTNSGWPTVNFTVVTSRYGQPVGYFGITTNRAISNFAYWELNDA
jgi:hypothetical protein